jgi:hemerythrin-like domain-containing protein
MAATEGITQADPWEMALIHRLIRRGFEQSQSWVLEVPDDSSARVTAVAEYVGFHLDGLQVHHTTEDELIWPALHARAEMSAALIDRMEEQHAGLHDALETNRARLDRWSAAPTPENAKALATALRATDERLGEHLAEEERDVVPLIAAHVTQAEWDDVGKVAFGKFTSRQRLIATGQLFETAEPAEAARMMAGLPAPVRVMWRLVGRRQYRRFIEKVRGA